MTVSLEPKRLASPADFMACPIWRYDDEDDLYHPILEPDQLPESERDLSTRALFVTPGNKRIDGYVVGISRVFSIALFGGDRLFHVNKNMKKLSEENIQRFIIERPEYGLVSAADIFPLGYSTQIFRPGYRDFSGVFDIYN
jgi:hypothetical protein